MEFRGGRRRQHADFRRCYNGRGREVGERKIPLETRPAADHTNSCCNNYTRTTFEFHLRIGTHVYA